LDCFFCHYSCKETKERTVIIEKDVEKDKWYSGKGREKVDKELNEKNRNDC